jgi:hypothetical protein
MRGFKLYRSFDRKKEEKKKNNPQYEVDGRGGRDGLILME